LLDWRLVAGTLLALAAIAGIQQFLLGTQDFKGTLYTHFNNYRIYKFSFLHLVGGQDLYARHPLEHWDLFKYSPTFAALMAPFALLPDAVGLVLWNLLNAGVLVLALHRLELLTPRSRALLGWFLVPEALTAFQNLQANVLVAGLAILAYTFLESDRTAWGSLLIVTAFYVKVYPALAALLFLLYPRKWRFVLWSMLWLALLGALPLLFVTPEHLRSTYESWIRLLTSDRSALTGLSVMGILHSWFNLGFAKNQVALVGAAIGLVPLLRTRAHSDPRFRLAFLASLLIWMVIFNHAAESATYAVAVCGVGLWYFIRPRGLRDTLLLGLAFLLTSMSPRFPHALVIGLVEPYALKALPCFLIWLVAIWELATWEHPAPAAIASTPPAGRA
jgi:hypothetical protein